MLGHAEIEPSRIRNHTKEVLVCLPFGAVPQFSLPFSVYSGEDGAKIDGKISAALQVIIYFEVGGG
jgi:hypothetical protein